MSKMVRGFIFLSASVLATSAFAEGHIKVDNHTNSSISTKCGHDGDAGKIHSIDPGHVGSMKIHDHGSVKCSAYNDHGTRVASRTFHFDHGDETYKWKVSEHHSD